MRFAWFGAGAALALILAVGCSEASKPEAHVEGATGASRQAIQGGALDTEHPFAVGVCGDFNGSPQGQCGYRCSGALITPNLVVTARHCVQQTPKEILCDQNPTFGGGNAPLHHITTNPSMSGSTGKHTVKDIIVPSDTHICGNDIALLILDDLIAPSEAKPIVPGVQYDMGDPRYGSYFTAIGYGNTGPTGNTSGTRRILQQIPLLCIPGDQYVPCPAEVNVNEFVGGDGTCEGDSGSSAYEQKSFNKDINTVVSWGVLSRGGVSQDGTMCQGSIYTRLDKWRDLIIKTANQASAGWTLYSKPVPDWTGPFVPLPTKDAGAKDAAKPGPGSLGLGESCTGSTECSSNLCVDAGGTSKVCSSACTETTPCGDGFTCQSGFCLAAPASGDPNQAAPQTTTTTSGCAVSSPSRPSPWGVPLGLGLGLGLALARRRVKRP